jgi:hypothetical protein
VATHGAAIATGALVSLRLLPELLGSLMWVLPGIAGVVFSGWVWFGAGRRYRQFMKGTHASAPAVLPGGGPLLALKIFGIVWGLGCVVLALSVG